MFDRPRWPLALKSPNEPGESLIDEGSAFEPGTSASTFVKSRPFTGSSETWSPCSVAPCVLFVVFTSGTSAVTSTLSVRPAESVRFTRCADDASTRTPFTVWDAKPVSVPVTS